MWFTPLNSFVCKYRGCEMVKEREIYVLIWHIRFHRRRIVAACVLIAYGKCVAHNFATTHRTGYYIDAMLRKMNESMRAFTLCCGIAWINCSWDCTNESFGHLWRHFPFFPSPLSNQIFVPDVVCLFAFFSRVVYRRGSFLLLYAFSQSTLYTHYRAIHRRWYSEL